MKFVALGLALVAIVHGETSVEYLPPGLEITSSSNEYIAPALVHDTIVADDGYRYKTVHRLRQRRNVSELPSVEYSPVSHEAVERVELPSNQYLLPEISGGTILENGGYRYKTVRRLRNRRKREATNVQYLPPSRQSNFEIAPSNEYLPPAGAESALVGDDGYRYKIIRRLKFRRN